MDLEDFRMIEVVFVLLGLTCKFCQGGLMKHGDVQLMENDWKWLFFDRISGFWILSVCFRYVCMQGWLWMGISYLSPYSLIKWTFWKLFGTIRGCSNANMFFTVYCIQNKQVLLVMEVAAVITSSYLFRYLKESSGPRCRYSIYYGILSSFWF